ncbi:MAG: methionyl-tRNA formyltransferase [Chitinivibrionales bacterium]|nr:methionyl-tRNA formyltransferase [Chitinivibrionales bacterium]
MKIIFLGSADFGIPALEKLRDSGHDIAGIVTTPPRPKGRGLSLMKSPVERYAEEHGISPVFTPEDLKGDELAENLSRLQAELFIVVAFRILPKKIFSIPPLGTINIHASLLPRYRGAAPIQRAIQAGETETGVTVFRIDVGIDTGNILMQKGTPIDATETTPQLYKRLQHLGASALIESVEQLEKGTVHYRKQDPAKVSPAPKLKKEEGRIDWNRPAHEIFNMIRAFKPFPGVYTSFNNKKINIEWALPSSTTTAFPPGIICAISQDGFAVQCKESSLNILELKPEGKKRMSAHAFLQGRTLTTGQKFQ